MVELFGLIDIQTISMASAAIGVLAGVVNWIIRLKRAERQRQTEIKTRQAQLLMDIYDHFLDPDITEAYSELYSRSTDNYAEYLRTYIEGGSDIEFVLVGRYLVGIGVLVKNELIDISLVYDLMAWPIMQTWEKYKPIVEGRRVELDFPLWEDVEYLYDELKKYEEQLSTSSKKKPAITLPFSSE